MKLLFLVIPLICGFFSIDAALDSKKKRTPSEERIHEEQKRLKNAKKKAKKAQKEYDIAKNEHEKASLQLETELVKYQQLKEDIYPEILMELKSYKEPEEGRAANMIAVIEKIEKRTGITKQLKIVQELDKRGGILCGPEGTELDWSRQLAQSEYEQLKNTQLSKATQ